MGALVSKRLSFCFLLLAGVARAPEAVAQTCAKPNILVVLDVSGSMNEASSGSTKYQQAVSGIDTALSSLQDKANFGLMLFPSPQGAGYAEPTGLCNVSHLELELGFTQNAKAAFADHLKAGGAHYFGGPKSSYDTPLYQALSEATHAAFGSINQGTPTYVLLISDGIQDCYAQGSPQDFGTQDKERLNGVLRYSSVAAQENREAIANMAAYLASGYVPTYAVGFAGGVDPLTLNGIADAAGTKRDPSCNPASTSVSASNNCYYQANNASQLTTALSLIVQSISVERCNGKDDDCDGQADDGLTESCTACNGKVGARYCTNGGMTACSVQKTATDTTCDGIDDDCDGTADDDVAVRACARGYCGVQSCKGGAWVGCTAAPPEVCNGKDDDCDGIADNGIVCGCNPQVDKTRTCGATTGECTAGSQRCVANASGGFSWSACSGGTPPAPELCNGKDDNCANGLSDDGADEGACQTKCGPGHRECKAGVPGACVPDNAPPEVCNGADDDCDGEVDEGDAGGRADESCMAPGACGLGKRSCGADGKLGACVPVNPPAEICDGVDNNCDGKTDEDCGCTHGQERPCGKNVAECTQGVEKCQYGQWTQCVGANNGRKEECNGVDDDCDGMIDENDDGICGASETCVCGGCAPTCADDKSCKNGGRCVDGLCQIDYCQVGMSCRAGKCEEGDVREPETPKVEQAPPLQAPRGLVRDGCACGAADARSMSGNALVVALALWLRSRSRCRRSR
jgi:Putative metal-binding motif/von Willebrand factor type A domain